MNRIFGYFIGVVWLGLAYGAFQRGAAGAGILTIAALGALIGTTIHARADRS